MQRSTEMDNTACQSCCYMISAFEGVKKLRVGESGCSPITCQYGSATVKADPCYLFSVRSFTLTLFLPSTNEPCIPQEVDMTQGELFRGLGIPCGQFPLQCLPQTLVSVLQSPTGPLPSYCLLNVLHQYTSLNLNTSMCPVNNSSTMLRSSSQSKASIIVLWPSRLQWLKGIEDWWKSAPIATPLATFCGLCAGVAYAPTFSA